MTLLVCLILQHSLVHNMRSYLLSKRLAEHVGVCCLLRLDAYELILIQPLYAALSVIVHAISLFPIAIISF